MAKVEEENMLDESPKLFTWDENITLFLRNDVGSFKY